VGNYKLDIATDSLFNEITYSILTDINFHMPLDSLKANQTYFWRVSAANECGNAVSEIFQFTTETISNIQLLLDKDYRIYPNPTKDFITVEMSNYRNNLEVYASSGKLLQKLSFAQQTLIDLSDYPSGMYWVKLINSKGMIVKKVIVE